MSSDATETLYVSGLPNDTRENELARLFEDMPGYETCRVVPGQKETTFGFVTFSAVADAVDAKQEKKDLSFEGHPLSIYFAKPKEERERRERQKQDLKTRERNRRDDRPRQQSPPQRERDYSRCKSTVNAQAMGPYERVFRKWEIENGMDNPSREDLQEGAVCIMGLPQDVTQRELLHLLRPFDGFTRCDLLSGDGNRDPLAFANFSTKIVTLFVTKMLDGYEFDRDHHIKVQIKRSKKRKDTDQNRDRGDRGDRSTRNYSRDNHNSYSNRDNRNDDRRERTRNGPRKESNRGANNDQSDDRGYIGNREWK
eukprot:TRINITY_DN1993_c2_g1_i1.p1 TRINITY_DN1993_c2_g1~~TRINITY_DN1993_c2_g1_i1.p1  ORF type:complete len:311 (+),score=35.36 TRINITY_DN1993_c2_g1_i1:41-973(+)